jgi:hypothetical protein
MKERREKETRKEGENERPKKKGQSGFRSKA